MSKDEIAPIADDEVDDILDALDSFGATVTQATSLEPSGAVPHETIGGCTIYHPDFTRR